MLYYEKPYLQEFTARVLKREGNRYLLNNTILYEGGGGQPADIGYVDCNGERKKIVHIGNLWHEVDCGLGEKIKIQLDWNFRYLMMRSHTAEHAFFRFLQNKGAKLIKISLGRESSIFFQGNISVDDVFEAEEKTKKMIEEGREVKVFWINKSDMDKYPELRIKSERIKEERIRVVKIENHDLSACKGIHVKNLREIGDFLVVKFRGGKRKEIKFKVGEFASRGHFQNSVFARRLAWENNVEPEKLELFVKNLKNENIALNEILKKETDKKEFNEVKCGDIKIFWQIFYDDRIGVRKSMEKVKGGGVIIFGNPIKKSVSCTYDFRYPQVRKIFMELIKKSGGKGGGKGNFLSGATNEPQSFIDEFIRELCNGGN